MYCEKCKLEKAESESCENADCTLPFTKPTEFDIESLDPAERSWYYDGAGVKRRKPSNE